MGTTVETVNGWIGGFTNGLSNIEYIPSGKLT